LERAAARRAHNAHRSSARPGWSANPSPVLSPISLLFGLIYARAKSLLLLVPLHGLVDAPPNLADFIRLWT
jgi:hypothetical protein